MPTETPERLAYTIARDAAANRIDLRRESKDVSPDPFIFELSDGGGSSECHIVIRDKGHPMLVTLYPTIAIMLAFFARLL
jgi:hypothetical protein